MKPTESHLPSMTDPESDRHVVPELKKNKTDPNTAALLHTADISDTFTHFTSDDSVRKHT